MFYTKVQFLQRQAASLLLYQSILKLEVGVKFLDLLQAIRYLDSDGQKCLQAYSDYFYTLADINQNWEEFLIEQILIADNPFTKLAQQRGLADIPSALVTAAQRDLQILQTLYECNSAVLSEWVQFVTHSPVSPVVWYREPEAAGAKAGLIRTFHELGNWADVVADLTAYYRKFGTGLLAEYRAFRWQSGHLLGISYPDEVKVDTLVGYDWQKDALLKNTQFLLSGEPALHVLLYGSRGSGKSSLVKSLLHEFSGQHLCLIEVAKSELQDLPKIVEQLRAAPQKFIIFVDDLSFEDDDDAFKSLKVVLEGGLTAKPRNVVIYATSNRRHLIREFFTDRLTPQEHTEVHAGDTMQEKLSFSDRFGLTLTFPAADQMTYLKIVQHLAAQANIKITPADLEYQALQWATRHNGRSGRTAKQFAVRFGNAELPIQLGITP
jgi:predicted AAA+ superfamily ATPase